MKKNLTLLLLLSFFALTTYAQSNRMLLAEGFTSSTCGPCASQNPAFDALLHNNLDKITSIKYHMSWPAPGNDPMYLHNTVDNNARRSYYNINSVPHVYLSGNIFHGMPSQINQTMINNNANQPADFDVVMQHRLNASQDSIFVTMLIKANVAVSGTLIAHIAVIEKEIHFTTAPGTNGEKDFYNVMKALIPTRNGTVLPDFEANEYVILEASWKLANVYNINQLAAVGFVQNNTTKYVYQAANSTIDPVNPFYTNDAEVKSIENGTAFNCSGSMNPKAVITNNSSAPLTSATVEFAVNGQTVQTVNWTGSLAFRQTAVVEAGQINFGLLNSNELTATITTANGSADGYLANNSFGLPFVSAPILTDPVTVYLLLNTKPEETSWELLNGNGEVVQSGGPYTTPGAIITQVLNMPQGACYEFVIKDAAGNGLCCGDGIGFYAILEGSNTTPIFSGQSFGYEERNQIAYGFVGVDEKKAQSDIQLVPNPASHDFNFTVNIENTSDVVLRIHDLSGRLIISDNFRQLGMGQHTLSQSVRDLRQGVYMVSIEYNNSINTARLVVE
ncbi:MAG: hypothetical protein FD155_2115 [Bacteroidetes bacterium]|nr:MAG: hypothetical protein FD155_2115 [Bacteroidota bacterium]